MKKFLIKNDHVLVGLVLALWSWGRIINPFLNISLMSQGGNSSALSFAAVLYILMHAVVFLFALWLLVSSSPQLVKKSKVSHASLWQIVLYSYVLAMTAISLYFFTYEIGI